MSIIKGTTDATGINLDPRTKLLLLIIVNILVFHSNNSYLSFIMICLVCSLFLLNKKYKIAIYSILLYFLFTLVIIYVIPYMTGVIVYLILIVLVTVYKLLPIMLMGAYFILTTHVSEFIASMENLHMPQEIIIPLAVFFRFIPTVMEEGKSIADAMKMSGLGFNIKNIVTRPFKMLEYWFIPLIMSIVKTGDELSSAVLTRSMDNPVQRTNICEIGFHIIDFIYILIALILLIMGFV